MGRFATVLAVLFAMLWQAGAPVRSAAPDLADLEHAALHWHETSHHHRADGSFHLDDSAESVQHVLSDSATASAAPPSPVSNILAPLGSAAPGGLHERIVPAPTLDGLLRPPRSRA